MISLTRIALALFGLGCLAAAAIIDMDLVRKHASPDGYFVQTYVSVDGAVKPDAAAALRTARVALVLFGLTLVGAAGFLRRIVAGHSLQSVLQSRRVHWLTFLTPIAILVALAAYKVLHGVETLVYKFLTTEDGPAEYLTAIAFLISFAIGCLAVKLLLEAGRRYLALYFALLSGFCLFVGLEEISYGQRLFGFSTPEVVAQNNRQNEFNVHNLDVLRTWFFHYGPVAIGVFGALGIFLSFISRYAGGQWLALASLLVPPWFLSSWFAPLALFTILDQFYSGYVDALVEWQDQELAEALLALGFLGFVAYAMSRLRELLIHRSGYGPATPTGVKSWKATQNPKWS